MSKVKTKKLSDYIGINGLLYKHKVIKHSAKEFVNGMAHTNGIKSVWAVAKHRHNGIYHNWMKKHCGVYINEFVFRLNDDNCASDVQDRLNSLFSKMTGKKILNMEFIT